MSLAPMPCGRCMVYGTKAALPVPDVTLDLEGCRDIHRLLIRAGVGVVERHPNMASAAVAMKVVAAGRVARVVVVDFSSMEEAVLVWMCGASGLKVGTAEEVVKGAFLEGTPAHGAQIYGRGRSKRDLDRRWPGSSWRGSVSTNQQ